MVGEGVWTGTKVERGAESTRQRAGGLVVAVAPPTSRERSRFLVEKLAELGVESLVWLKTERGSARIPSRDKQRAWTASALEQSRGAWLMSTSETLVGFADLEPPVVVCSPNGIEPDAGLEPRTVAIGPEGGLSPNEVPSDAVQVNLAKTILRIETAAIAAAIIFK
jgi:RsmE family RNA methyltransferase